MKALILGCGQMGAELAVRLAKVGVAVTVVDRDEDAFLQLPGDFGGGTVAGDGIDDGVLRAAGAGEAQVLVVATADDNFNLMAAQLVRARFKVPKVLARVYDPAKAALFRELGLETYCPTKETATALERMITGGGK